MLCTYRDIEPGEVIMEEKPITVGPRQFTPPTCLGCYKCVERYISIVSFKIKIVH